MARIPLMFGLLLFTALAAVPPAAATCAPTEIDYTVGQSYAFTCEGGFHGVLGVDLSQQEPALDVCFGSQCYEVCGNVFFYGTAEGEVTIDVVNMYFDQFGFRLCTATVGTIYIYG